MYVNIGSSRNRLGSFSFEGVNRGKRKGQHTIAEQEARILEKEQLIAQLRASGKIDPRLTTRMENKLTRKKARLEQKKIVGVGSYDSEWRAKGSQDKSRGWAKRQRNAAPLSGLDGLSVGSSILGLLAVAAVVAAAYCCLVKKPTAARKRK